MSDDKRLPLHPCATRGCGRLTVARYCRRCMFRGKSRRRLETR